ncbi:MULTISPECIES: MBL fold metallo-hydrolase [Klebsiella]|uniref:MBL fold metallo-hydrolase n=1 Tax=Klebsiella TaxID=570 RepID=UPI001BE01E76|nr:MBL fold metallo-hydrolase [Klebsiella pneumoniae]HBV9912671.1 MBL fold metallo-hydrolase [Klebsiella aerogenes]MBT1552500.1 MBL fold metallo-hydrolase [Klebsiella pneumoniae]MBT1663607.1 MBL fold metallo-hydrolase [Klebsiella pneumoniae]MCM2177352.1 MBL fold metallo-hydrolase [Klebsiella pneumoniae]MCQ0505552.1 MBL fold metallo-hydrolase [Klebsiella pneumoniae]
MGIRFTKAALLSLSLTLSVHALADPLQCENKDFTLQTLGTGGPITDDQRASSGEVIWLNGKSALLIDAGGGVFLRFGQSGARLEDLKLIAISHFHTDHVADLAAILKGGYFIQNKEVIDLVGPTGGGAFPSMTQYFNDLFKKDDGAYSYLNGLYNATDGIKLATKVRDIDYTSAEPQLVYQDDEMKITALGIPHGDVPCLAFRIETAKGTIVVSADQNGSNKAFIPFAKGADMLVMPLAIDENADAESKFIHAAPDVVGKVAAEINPKVLILNHYMGKGLLLKDESVKIVKQYYHGTVYASRDLACFPISLAKK